MTNPEGKPSKTNDNVISSPAKQGSTRTCALDRLSRDARQAFQAGRLMIDREQVGNGCLRIIPWTSKGPNVAS
jgi:hypothetical protein